MRVIVNLHSHHVAKIAGWRAKAVQINEKNDSNLKETLKAVIFENNNSMYDIIIENNHLKNNFILIVNGMQMHLMDLKTKIKDNVQIHLMDKPGILLKNK